ncbi:MAG: hypothetical protein COX70_08170 [Flavobacteriales bacterium CG_4_10_14_0_2_um_filter_32_8]|nr:MAG: hypothetical protein COX70_08170 [Flavobacteriales bacterium CG_4_10_14_0_2_um_filter_32_8]PJB14278.1 MAG: hypothetical protein CO118_09420 [Flavobacteriales bacterium CG_4_9_14_3_um_filter_32_8]
MKFFTFLFSFYLFILAVMPCSNQNDCEYSIEEQSFGIATNHTEHQNEAEHCSPFCMCACCIQSCNFTKQQINFALIFPIISKKIIVYHSLLTSPFCYSIWQPPKLS